MPRNVRGIDRTADRVREDQCIPFYGNIFVLRQEAHTVMFVASDTGTSSLVAIPSADPSTTSFRVLP